jgi:hypothetical protein
VIGPWNTERSAEVSASAAERVLGERTAEALVVAHAELWRDEAGEEL